LSITRDPSSIDHCSVVAAKLSRAEIETSGTLNFSARFSECYASKHGQKTPTNTDRVWGEDPKGISGLVEEEIFDFGFSIWEKCGAKKRRILRVTG